MINQVKYIDTNIIITIILEFGFWVEIYKSEIQIPVTIEKIF